MSGSPISPDRPRLEAEWIAAADWRDVCERTLASGERFAAAFASGSARARTWSAVFTRGGDVRVLRTEMPTGAAVDSIVDRIPAADWDEREAHDLHGLDFNGRASTRALVEHTAELESWTTPVAGKGVHQLAVGPIHAGVIESGHFRFHAVGERILAIDLRLFYKHRGLEFAAEGAPLDAALAYAQRACGACAVSNAVAYAQACEALQGREVAAATRRARTVLLELERVYNHLNDIAAICAGVGFAVGNMAFAALKERALRLNHALTGHRFLFDSVSVGGSAIELAAEDAGRLRETLRAISVDAASCWRELEFAASLQARLDAVGVLSEAEALRLGAVGPAARASGIRADARTLSSGLEYPGSFAAASLDEPLGDVAARLRIRAVELEQSFEILDRVLGESLEVASAERTGLTAAIGVGRVESPRGETICVLEAEQGAVRRMHLRTGSYANWPALAAAVAGELMPDFPLINKSFELCYGCADR